MKTFAQALLFASAAALDMEFIQGCQQGFFTMNETQIYNEQTHCQRVELLPQVETFVNMVKPGIQMVQNMNVENPVPALNYLADATDELAFLYSLFYGYRGSPFCKGMIFSHEIASLALEIGQQRLATVFPIFDKNFNQ